MDGHTSPARFLAYLLTEHDISVTQLCDRCGLDSDIAWAFLAGRLPVTQTLAEQLDTVFHSPASGSPVRPSGCGLSQMLTLRPVATGHHRAKLTGAGTGLYSPPSPGG